MSLKSIKKTTQDGAFLSSFYDYEKLLIQSYYVTFAFLWLSIGLCLFLFIKYVNMV